ncbi:MAG TPA: ATP-binding protein [Chitinophagaceae bacterium]|nr:ATP-binding protein [Chitinophagaceae bacterium]
MQKAADSIAVFLIVTTCVILTLAAFIFTLIYLYRKRQVRYLKDVEQLKSDYEKNLLKTQLEIQEQTFQNISREIHDNINLSLTIAKLNLITLESSNGQIANEKLLHSIDFVSRAISDLSDISRSLNSEIITEQGLIKALEVEVRNMKKLGRHTITYEITGNTAYLDAQKELFIFRIVQESFNNILKHANAKNILLALHYTTHSIDISIKDDGVGFNYKEETNSLKKGKAGLRNIQKRAFLLNGICKIDSTKNCGTLIKISVPF